MADPHSDTAGLDSHDSHGAAEAAAAADAFFKASPSLEGEEVARQGLRKFMSASATLDAPVVCVTSGGTTVPLERRCVRFIDNFSAGNRGAASTEYFLESGYQVVFLFRRGSMRPFCRGLPESPVLSCLTVTTSTLGEDSIAARDEFKAPILRAVKETQQAVESSRLLLLPFTTLFQYLQLLRITAEALSPLGPRGMFYLAAAVSDFYVPWESMVEHKIQSASGPLDIQLALVPKMLHLLRTQWAPHAFVVSFKLETDSEILLHKARGARRKYGVHAVVANELLTRARKVVVLSEHGEDLLTLDAGTGSAVKDIEQLIVRKLMNMHQLQRQGP